MTTEEIHTICLKYKIENYTINDDYSIDVDGNVSLCYKNLIELPLKFRNVSGDFYCYSNKLTSLEGAPSYVGKWFDCSFNLLTSLEGIPLNLSEKQLNLQANFTYNDYLKYRKVVERDLKFKKLLK